MAQRGIRAKEGGSEWLKRKRGKEIVVRLGGAAGGGLRKREQCKAGRGRTMHDEDEDERCLVGAREKVGGF